MFEISNLKTSMLVRMKHSLLKKAQPQVPLTKANSKLLLDILGELDCRKYCS